MRTIFHHLRFEIRGHRLFLLIWFVILAISAIHWGYRFQVVDGDQLRGTHFPSPSPFVDLLACFIALSLGIRDTPAGTGGFWMTRPLRARQLLTAKLLFLFGVVLIPWAIHDAAIALGQGVGVGGAFRAVLAQVAMHWAAPCIAFGLTTLTNSLQRALLALFGGLIVLGVGVPALMVLRNLLMNEGLVDNAFLLAWLVGLAALIGSSWMFLTRQPRAAWKVTLFSTLGLLAVGFGFALPAASRILNPAEERAFGVDSVQVSVIDQRRGEGARMTDSGRRKFVYANANLRIDRLPGQFAPRVRLTHGRLEFPDGSVREWPGYRVPGLSARTEFRRPGPLQQLLDDPDVEIIPPDDDFEVGPRSISIRITPDSGLPASTAKTVKFSGETSVELVEFTLLGALPLSPNSAIELEDYRIELISREILHSSHGLRVSLRSRQFHDPLAGGADSASFFAFLHHPAKGVVILTKSDGMHPRLSGPVGLKFRAEKLLFRNPGGEIGAIDESWLEDARLIVVKRQSVGEVRREIEIPELELAPGP